MSLWLRNNRSIEGIVSMKIKRIYLSQKRGGNGYISGFSVSIEKNEAQACGFIQMIGPC